ncbi:hypothetical protein DH2020_045843 [Rehmannia glutinosa]|uniref:DNA polymerase n=1 Tax=Rehmannia glutinosa TaxID=99300 RepID=A0ABR0UDJ3_REHGL
MKIPFIKGKSIVFRENGKDLPVYDLVLESVLAVAENYEDADLLSLILRIYIDGIHPGPLVNLSDDEVIRRISEWLSIRSDPNQLNVAKVGGPSKRRYSDYLTPLKPSIDEKAGFIVADTETLLIPKDDASSIENKKIHIPYAIGFLVVSPDDYLSSLNTRNVIETYFSEDYPNYLFDTFEKRSSKMMNDFVDRLALVCENNKQIKTVYFHNFARFDGILLLKHFLNLGDKYEIKPLIYNLHLYEISVYKRKKLLFNIRDSYTLLPGKLNDLANNLCPSLGVKGNIDHESVTVENLSDQKYLLLEYMKQDIRLLGGVMLKAQEIIMSNYNVDIVYKLTVSSLALTIFRTRYYDEKENPIYLPSMNEDRFIRRGYYGGHTDAYIPFGENLYYYDVNSLYPFIMKSFKMPSGKPLWHGKLEDRDLDDLYGFIEAYVDCPETIKRPFLPYRDPKKTLIFPTGKFVGVYYSEELKYARDLGYTIVPLKGYLFNKLDSRPFESFVSDIFEKRQEAKRNGNDAMSYIYKILMNSLYGRFGINPELNVTVICDYTHYMKLIKNKGFKDGNKLSEYHYIVTYSTNKEVDDTEWNPPKISAVQLSAVITACARIYMYPFISKEDCYYTDTDSVVLGSPLPENWLSETDLGKFKCECLVRTGYFLAPKSYNIHTQDGKSIIKQKGLSKSLVDQEWFEKQYEDIERTLHAHVTSYFSIDWDNWEIGEKKTKVKLGILLGNKRELIIDENKTKPIHVSNSVDTETKLTIELKKLKDINAEKAIEIERLKEEMLKKESEWERLSKDIEEGRDEGRDIEVERRSDLRSQAQDRSGETDEWKDEGH